MPIADGWLLASVFLPEFDAARIGGSSSSFLIAK
jgi:hypothetical protein